MTDTIETVEIFESLQGEGPLIGHPAVFLRTRRCNQACQFCDSRYTWDRNDPGFNTYEVLALEQIAERVNSYKRNLLVITGGEPMLWQREIQCLIPLLNCEFIQIETAGTVPTNGFWHVPLVRYVVSPKLSSSGNLKGPLQWQSKGILTLALYKNMGAAFKFVVTDLTRDVLEIREIQRRLHLQPEDIYIMPEGTTRESVLRGLETLMEPCMKYGWNLAPRLHILLWGNTRGK